MPTRPDILLVSALPGPLTQALEQRYNVYKEAAAAPPSIRALVGGGMSHIDAPLLDRFAQLELIAIHGVGFDKVDRKEAERRGVALRFTDGVLTNDVADLALGLMLAVHRRIVDNHKEVAGGGWKTSLATRVSGRVMGIYGMGNIGQAIAQRVAPFASSVCYTSRTAKADLPWRYLPDLPTLAAQCEVLFVAAAASAETKHAVDARVLQLLGAKGVLINIARGSLVDEDALIAALAQGSLAGAGLDVFANEPHVPQALQSSPQVVLSPHQASATLQCRQQMADAVLTHLKNHLGAGSPPAEVQRSLMR